MRCAMDLMTMAVARKVEIEEQKRIREEDRKAQVIQNTLSWCEEIGEVLENMAFKGEKPVYVHLSSIENTNGDICLVKGIKGKYADPRRLSYEEYGNRLNLDLIKKWFNEFCFEVEVKEVLYYKYGWGCLRRYRLVIKPNPNCL